MNPRKAAILLFSILSATGCVGSQQRDAAPGSATGPAAKAGTLSPLEAYLAVLSGVSPGDAVRQQTTIEQAAAVDHREPSASHRLAYALAIGSAGRPDSNPTEARNIIVELLATPSALTSDERTLAEAFQREFDARVVLDAELTRQREEAASRTMAVEADAAQRNDALAAENARLRRAISDADRKLKAVAEMERQLLDHGGDSTEPPPTP